MATETNVSKLRVQPAESESDSGPVLLEIDPLVSVLAASDSGTGRWVITGDGQLLGEFQGDIECAGDLMIGKGADVTATIRGNTVTISGRVRGNVTAVGRLKITPTGRLDGDAKVGALVVQEGGVHHGTTRVYPEGVPEEDEASAQPVAVAAPPETAQTPVDRVRKFWGEFF
jgi:cytoskeletal protein CcmA (bactofilin family)